VDGSLIRTRTWKITTTIDDPLTITRLPIFLDAAYRQYTSLLGPLPDPPQKLDVYILSDRRQWALLTRQLMGDRADTYLRIDRGGFAADGRSVLYDIGQPGLFSVAAHEGWHQYTQRAFGRFGLPIWLEEGIATYMEGFRWRRDDPTRPDFLPWGNIERFDQLREAVATESLLALPDLLDTTPRRLIDTSMAGALSYYAQVWALTHFLREGAGGRYRQSLDRLVGDAASGRLPRVLYARMGPARARRALRERRGPGVFQAYFNADLAQANLEYTRFVHRIVRTGSRDLVARGESPIFGAAGP